MLRFYKKELELDIRSKVNALSYFFRKIPLINKVFRSDSYKHPRVKSFLIAIAPIVRLLLTFLSSAIAFGILFAFITYLTNSFGWQGYDPLPVLLCLYAVSAITRYDLSAHHGVVRRFYELFHVKPVVLIRSKIFLDGALRAMARILIFLVASNFLSLSPIVAVTFPIVLFLLEIASNGVYTFLARRKLWSPKGVWAHLLFNLGLFVVSLWIVIQYRWDLRVLASVPCLLFAAFCALIGGRYVWSDSDYEKDLRQYDEMHAPNIADPVYAQQALRDANKLKTEDVEEVGAYESGSLEGYALLNQLFFRRHRRLLRKPIWIKSAIVAVAFIALFFVIKSNLTQVSPANATAAMAVLPGIIPLLGYLLFNQEKIAQSMFINCDQSFLQYGFYRRPKDLRLMFKHRLKSLVYWNFLPLGVFLLGTLALSVAIGLSPTDTFLLALQVIATAVFFSVHTLFVYYIFQPYDSELKVKSPAYSVINGAIYAGCFFIFPRFQAHWMAPLFIVLCIAYSAIALVSVYRFAPTRFHVWGE